MANIADLEFYFASKYLGSDGDTLTEQTADAGGSTTTLVDAALTEADDYWNGALCVFEDDTTTAALQGHVAHVKDFDAATDTLTFWSTLPAAVAAGDTYRLILGGNYRSSLQAQGYEVTAGPSNVTGVTIDVYGDANGAGDGTLSYTNADTSLTWTPPGGSAGSKVDVSSNGTYDLFGADNDKYITITVVAASLPGTDQTDTITAALRTGEIFPDMEGDESRDGKIRHWLFPVENGNGADTLASCTAYLQSSETITAATTTAAGKDTSAGSLACTDLSNWPTSGWMHNDTKNDVAYFYSRSGNTVYLKSRADACSVGFDAGGGGGANEIAVGDTVTGAGGASGEVVAIQIDSGTFAGNDAAGTLYLQSYNGTAFVNDEAVSVGATQVAIADGTETVGLRDHTAQSWDSGDTVSLLPSIDIGLDAPSTGQFESPETESHAPAGVTFSCPTTLADGLSIGDLAASATYGLWVRDWAVPDTRPQATVTDKILVDAVI